MKKIKKSLGIILAAVMILGLMPTMAMAEEPASTLTVADGEETSGHVPVYGFYADTEDSESQYIIPADMLTDLEGKEITDLTYYTTDGLALKDGKWTFYLYEVNETEFEEDKIIPYKDDAVEVCEVAYDVFLGESTITIEFTEPYVYNGGNLLVTSCVTEAGDWRSTFFYGVKSNLYSAVYKYTASYGTTYIHTEMFIPKTTITYQDHIPDTPTAVYTITAPGQITGGSVTAPAKTKTDDTVNVTVNTNAGYELTTLTYTPEGENAVEIKDTKSFTMPAKNVVINAVFTANEYTITTPSNLTGGSVTAPAKAKTDDEVALTVAPAEGYEIIAFAVTYGDSNTPVHITDGANAGEYTFKMPPGDVNVRVIFNAIDYKITPYSSETGSVTADMGTATIGTPVTLTVAPEEEYKLTEGSLKATYMKGENETEISPLSLGNYQYTFDMPAGDVTISAQFEVIKYNVNVTEGITGGTVQADKDLAAKDEEVTLTITPEKGYKFDELTVTDSEDNEVEVTDNAFIMPASDVNIFATFTRQQPATTGGGASGTVSFVLTYNTNGGSEIKSESHSAGDNVTLDKTPVKDGYTFTGWYADKECTQKIESITMNSSKTVYAGWDDGTQPVNPDENAPLMTIKIGDTKYQLNGVDMEMDSAPFIDENDRTMLPVRVVANALGISDNDIAWDNETKTASFTRPDGKVVSCTVGEKAVKIGDDIVEIDTAPVIAGDRIFLPMRALFNAFNVSDEHIIWDGAEKTVTVTKEAIEDIKSI